VSLAVNRSILHGAQSKSRSLGLRVAEELKVMIETYPCTDEVYRILRLNITRDLEPNMATGVGPVTGALICSVRTRVLVKYL